MDIRKSQALRDILKDKSLLKDKCYIDGKWVGGKQHDRCHQSGERETSSARCRSSAPAETREAIEAAEKAQKDWAEKTAKERAVILRKWFNLMMENQEDLAQIMTAEQGKPWPNRAAKSPMAPPSSNSSPRRPSASMARPFPRPGPMRRIVVIRQPVGVVAAITPWNFPNAMITRKAGPALAAGCAFVCKPASETPLSALAMAELGRARRHSGGRLQRHHRFGPRDRRRDDLEPDRPRAHLHRLDRDRQAADGAMRLDGEEGRPRARRQRALHRLRRCRSRCRGGGRHGCPNTAMPARPASAPTASWCRKASMTHSPRSSPRP